MTSPAAWGGAMSVKDTVESLVLPRGAAFRRLPLGVAAGHNRWLVCEGRAP